MRRNIWIAVGCLALSLMFVGCASRVPYRLTKMDEVYTQANLHPDPRRNLLYSVNYQQKGLIPVCTPVRIEQVTTEAMTFTRLDTDKKYEYVFHGSMPHSPTAHLDQYFGEKCPQDKLDSLGSKDKAGVDAGEVEEGMTKRGVIFAIGYPPAHKTPKLKSDTWIYWQSRFNTFQVHFEEGRVSRVQH